jgi:hypothetical protein
MKDVGRCIAGIHPPLNAALDLLQNRKVKGVPLSRRFSLQKRDDSVLLFYKTELAGVVEIVNKQAAVSLLPDYNHSTYISSLTELGVQINA